MAQDTRYRVELILLTHLNHDQPPIEALQLNDYSAALDFLSPPEETDESGDASELEKPVEDASALAPDPNEVVHMTEMSEVMREAWRRLRASAPFRPEQYLSWEQGNQEPFPVFRIHDLDVVLTEDPWAEARAELQEQLEKSGGTSVFADAAGLDELNSETPEPELPDPIQFFRLDGSVALTRSRFLHLELDLQLREAVWDSQSTLEPAIELAEPDELQPSSFLVHNLEQSRQVRSGRMEYFDGPVLGVLMFITSIKAGSKDSP